MYLDVENSAPMGDREMESRRRAGPENLRYHNDTMACLREVAGLSFPIAVHAFSVMDSYIYGYSQIERVSPSDIPEEAEARRDLITDDQAAFAEAFPYLAQIPVELRAMNYDYKQEFEFGLDLILDGIERMRDGESSSAKK